MSAGINSLAPVSSLNPIPMTGLGTSASVSITRPADTSAYSANDVVGHLTASTAAMIFSDIGFTGDVIVKSSEFEIDRNTMISGESNYFLHFYSVSPPSVFGDNVPWDLSAGDRASYLGFISLGTPVDLGSTLYIERREQNKIMTLAGTNVYAYLVTTGPYTPQSATNHKITLHFEPRG